jgi:sugar lactone lactonase YvrE
VKPRVPFALVLPALASVSCNVYDPALLTRRDAAVDVLTRDGNSDRGPGTDLAVDRPDDVAADVPPRPDAAMDAAVTDAPRDAAADAVADARVDAASDLGRDVPDVPADVPPSCGPTLAMGVPCIEPVTGHRWSPDEPRLVAPGALALTPDRLYVSDPGGARVMTYDLGVSPLDPARLAGTGVVGSSIVGGLARSTALSAIASMVVLPGGTVLLADRESHQVLRLRDGRLEPMSLGLSFPAGPFGLAYAPDTRELFVAGDNRLHVIALDPDGGVGSPTTAVGQVCGGSCPGFNGDGMAGTSTALAFPMGVDVDTTYVYFSDRDNCRVRRYRRSDPARVVETFAGSTCDLSGDPLGDSTTGFVPRAALRLGRVTDVRYGVDGSIYLVDASHCAVFQVVAPALTTARIVLGSRAGCGQPAAAGGTAIGRIGGIAMSADRGALYVSDTQGQRVLRVENTAMGGSPRVGVAQAPGAIPRPDEDAAGLRAGQPSGLALLNDAATLLLAGSAEARVYRVDLGRARVVLGDGTAPPGATAAGLPATTLPPTSVAGISGDGARAVLGMPERGVIAELTDLSGTPTLGRLAGRYTAEVLDAGASRDGGADAATEVDFVRPAWPFTQTGQTWFGDARARVWRITSGAAEVVAGTGAPSVAALPDAGVVPARSAPLGSAVAFAVGLGGTLYIADPQRYVVWSVDAAEQARVAAGVLDRPAPLGDDPNPATSLGLARPVALAFDGADTLFIADASANRVRAVTISTGRMTTVAGSGPASGAMATTSGDYGPARSATLAQPTALAWSRGRLYVAEGASGRVRVVTLP